MNPVSDVQSAGGLLLRLEAIELLRSGDRDKVRALIAGKLRAAPTTLTNIRQRRVKSVPSWLMDRIKRELVAALQLEIGRLQNEVDIHLQAGLRLSESEVAAAQAHLEAAKLILLGER